MFSNIPINLLSETQLGAVSFIQRRLDGKVGVEKMATEVRIRLRDVIEINCLASCDI